MRLRLGVYKLFNAFVSRINKKWQVEASESNDRVVTNFLLEIHKVVHLHSVGYEYIYNYLIFHVYNLRTQEVSFGNKISFVRVFGKSAFDRYKKGCRLFPWLKAESILLNYGIRRSLLDIFNSRQVRDYKIVKKIEEMEKLRFLNTPEGFRNCMEMTTLFNHNSVVCMNCKFNKECKAILSNLYYGIYFDRGYA